jgi:hypothetical protein
MNILAPKLGALKISPVRQISDFLAKEFYDFYYISFIYIEYLREGIGIVEIFSTIAVLLIYEHICAILFLLFLISAPNYPSSVLTLMIGTMEI